MRIGRFGQVWAEVCAATWPEAPTQAATTAIAPSARERVVMGSFPRWCGAILERAGSTQRQPPDCSSLLVLACAVAPHVAGVCSRDQASADAGLCNRWRI